MRGVRIRGDGVAGCCCAHLLRAAGIRVTLEGGGQARVPALLVGEGTQRLFGDVFGREDLFAGLPQIERRVVAWGSNPAVELPHRAVVIAEEELAARLRPALADESAGDDWTICASRPLPEGCTEHQFGARTATASEVELDEGGGAFWIESLEAGWLFLISPGNGAGWLLAVGSGADALLTESQLIAPQIRGRGPAGAAWPAHPRIATPLCGPAWLSCGTAAVSFDPICGDGTGYALREAILAAAVIRAAAQGEDADELRAHYTARVVAGFRRHVELSQEYYRAGGSGAWWTRELEALQKGVDWCREQEGGPFRYRLNGFELQRAG